jgi:hypothetical protein
MALLIVGTVSQLVGGSTTRLKASCAVVNATMCLANLPVLSSALLNGHDVFAIVQRYHIYRRTRVLRSANRGEQACVAFSVKGLLAVSKGVV